jgi:hypothetical protein
VAAVELEPADEELGLLRVRRRGIAGDDLLVPDDRVVVAIGAGQRAGAVEHGLRGVAAEARVDAEEQLAGVGVAPAHLEQRDAEPVVALVGDVGGDGVAEQRQLGDRVVPQMGNG